MTTVQIELLFLEAIEEKAIYNKLKGISEDKIYNWRYGRGRKPTNGEMLDVLYQLDLIKVYCPLNFSFDKNKTSNILAIEQERQSKAELLNKSLIIPDNIKQIANLVDVNLDDEGNPNWDNIFRQKK